MMTRTAPSQLLASLLLAFALLIAGCETPRSQPPALEAAALPPQDSSELGSLPQDSSALAQIAWVQAQDPSALGEAFGGKAIIAFDSTEHVVTWKVDPMHCFWGSITNRGDTLEDYFLGFSGGTGQPASSGWGMELYIPVSAAQPGAVLREESAETRWLLRIHNRQFHAFCADTLPFLVQIDEWGTQPPIVTGRLSGKLDDALSDKVVWVKSLFFRTTWCLDSLYVRMERQE